MLIRPLAMSLLVLTISSLLRAETQWIIMRHGEAESNVRHIINSDIKESEKFPLTDKGRDQVQKALQDIESKLNLKTKQKITIYSSPLSRAKQTSDVIKAQLNLKDIQVDARLREPEMGTLDGKSESELESLDNPPGTYLEKVHQKFNGESPKSVSKRLSLLLREIKSGLKLNQNNTVIIVTHGFPAKEVMRLLEAKPSQQRDFNRGEIRLVIEK